MSMHELTSSGKPLEEHCIWRETTSWPSQGDGWHQTKHLPDLLCATYVTHWATRTAVQGSYANEEPAVLEDVAHANQMWFKTWREWKRNFNEHKKLEVEACISLTHFGGAHEVWMCPKAIGYVGLLVRCSVADDGVVRVSLPLSFSTSTDVLLRARRDVRCCDAGRLRVVRHTVAFEESGIARVCDLDPGAFLVDTEWPPPPHVRPKSKTSSRCESVPKRDVPDAHEPASGSGDAPRG